MKSSLINILIGLMSISLIGIIVIQCVLIMDSIEEKEREFALHMNDALNAVNNEIDKEEAELFLEQEFGGSDSLLHDIFVHDAIANELHHSFNEDNNVVVIKDLPDEQIVFVESTADPIRQRIQIKLNSDSLEESIESLEELTIDLESGLHDQLEMQLERLDSTLENTIIIEEDKENRLEHITSVIRNFTFSSSQDVGLEDRFTKHELKSKIANALNNEGLDSTFEFAIYDHQKMDYEAGFISEKYEEKENLEHEFSKALFQNNKYSKDHYTLKVQSNSAGDFVWSRIRSMILLSILFTVLIIVSFGYALYFIFKQKKISQVKNDFINNMTHELKTPLASISLAASSIKHPEVINKKEEIEHFINIIESEEKRINSHIERVLNIASLDKGELKLNMEKCDLIETLQTSLKNVDLSLSESAGICHFDSVLTQAPIEADCFHLTNVLTNVLDNSIKYKRDDLKINISLKKADDSYIVTIEDNGIGMSLKEQQQAFDKFYRAESGDVHNRKGFGLGLSYVRSIISAHQGGVQIQSQLNKGTTIRIQLPLSQ